jgi:hypothetical protein
MRPLPQPGLDARTVYATCISKTRPAKAKARLQQLEDEVAAAAAEYEKAAAAAALHTLGHLKNRPDGDDEKPGNNKALTDITDHVWLAARLTEPPEPGVSFFVNPHPDWTPTLTARVQRHFQTYRLGRLYAAQVGTELAALNDYLRGKPHRAIVDELQHRAASYGKRNSWQAALYRALAATPWYVKSGYLNGWDD